MPNTRFSRRAQLIATCLGVGGLADSPAMAGGFDAPAPRCAGVTAARSLLCGAITPWQRVRYILGGDTSAANLAKKSSGSISMCVVPSRYGVFSAYRTCPDDVGAMRSVANGGRLT